MKYLLTESWGWPSGSAHQLSTDLPNWLFGAGALLIPLWMFNFRPNRWRSTPILAKETDQTLWRALATISMLYLLVGLFWFQHWYILWVFAPAMLLPDSHLTRSVLPWLAFGALSSNVLMDFISATTLKTTPPIKNYILSVVIIWGPVLFITGIQTLARRWDKHTTPIHT